MKARSKTKSQLNDSVKHRLDAYALAAAGAGNEGPCGLHAGPCHHDLARWSYLVGALGVLALAPLAEAKIVYTRANVYVHDGGTYYFHFDLNHDGVADVGLGQYCGYASGHGACWLYAKPMQQGNGIEGVIKSSSSRGWAAALKAGAVIGHAEHFDQSASVLMASHHRDRLGSGNAGYWNYSQARYLGVEFLIKGKIHYGWMRLKNSSDNGATLTGYAYETIPGKSIRAGQTKGPDDLTGEPNSASNTDPGPGASVTVPITDTAQSPPLGMLALGARAVPLWRRKEEMEVTK